MKLKEKQLQLQSHIHILVLWVQELSLLSYISPLAIVVLLTHQFPFCEEISFFFFFLPISLPFVLFISAQEEPAYSRIQISSCKTGDFSNWGKSMLWLQSMVLYRFLGFHGCISLITPPTIALKPKPTWNHLSSIQRSGRGRKLLTQANCLASIEKAVAEAEKKKFTQELLKYAENNKWIMEDLLSGTQLKILWSSHLLQKWENLGFYEKRSGSSIFLMFVWLEHSRSGDWSSTCCHHTC